jgi:hypothetical protein
VPSLAIATQRRQVHSRLAFKIVTINGYCSSAASTRNRPRASSPATATAAKLFRRRRQCRPMARHSQVCDTGHFDPAVPVLSFSDIQPCDSPHLFTDSSPYTTVCRSCGLWLSCGRQNTFEQVKALDIGSSIHHKLDELATVTFSFFDLPVCHGRSSR